MDLPGGLLRQVDLSIGRVDPAVVEVSRGGGKPVTQRRILEPYSLGLDAYLQFTLHSAYAGQGISN